MALDIAKNFAKVQVSTGYGDGDTTIVLETGHGTKLPTAPFNAVWWNSTDFFDPSDDPNVEIVRVTDVTSDTLTVTRAQESTSASTKNTAGKTYRMIAGLTAKTINTDLSNNFLITKSKSFQITYPTAGSTYALWKVPAGITITSIEAVQIGGTNLVGILTECDANGLNPVAVDTTDMTITTSNTSKSSFTNPAIDSGDWVGWKNTSISGAVSRLFVTFNYV